jgi:hypothetical protein
MTKKIELENEIKLIEARINQIEHSEHYSEYEKLQKIALQKQLLEKTQLELIKEIEIDVD